MNTYTKITNLDFYNLKAFEKSLYNKLKKPIIIQSIALIINMLIIL